MNDLACRLRTRPRKLITRLSNSVLSTSAVARYLLSLLVQMHIVKTDIVLY